MNNIRASESISPSASWNARLYRWVETPARLERPSPFALMVVGFALAVIEFAGTSPIVHRGRGAY